MGHWVTGFCDRSAAFGLSMSRKGGIRNWYFQLSFEIRVNIKDSYLLEALKDFFKVGKIYTSGDSVLYRVTGYSDLTVIINHFTSFPLVSSQYASFKLWSEAVTLIGTNQHREAGTFSYLLTIYAALGRGASKAVLEAFPDLTPITVPQHTLTIGSDTLNLWWLSGYLTLYCHFGLSIAGGGWGQSTYNKYRHSFNVSFDIIELPLAELICATLGLSLIKRSNGLRVDAQSRSLDQALNLTDFFDAYPLQSYKQEHFEVWREYVDNLDYHRRFLELQHRALTTPLTHNRFEQFAKLVTKLYKLRR
jgi:hypothetical protein